MQKDCTNALIWVTPSEAAARIKSAAQLGITLVDRKRDGKQVRLRFSMPAALTFCPKTDSSEHRR